MSSHKHQVRTCEKWGPKTYLQLLLITTGVAKKTKTDKMVTETETHIITPHFKVWIVCVHTHREQTVKNFFSADTRGQHMFPLLCDGVSFNTAAYKMPLLNSVLVKSKKLTGGTFSSQGELPICLLVSKVCLPDGWAGRDIRGGRGRRWRGRRWNRGRWDGRWDDRCLMKDLPILFSAVPFPATMLSNHWSPEE